nr:flavodoxin domain-containing protein [Sedimentibacter sp.]
MGNVAVIFKTKYGHTKKYAEWISQELKCDLFEQSEVSAEKMLEYDTLVYGGGLYASGILGIELITKNFSSLKDKILIVFTVGLADPEIKSQFEPIIQKNFTDEMQKSINIFHLRGGINYKELGIVHKAMMAALKSSVKKKDELTDEDRLMLETYGDQVEFSDKKTIEPLISFVRSMNQ